MTRVTYESDVAKKPSGAESFPDGVKERMDAIFSLNILSRTINPDSGNRKTYLNVPTPRYGSSWSSLPKVVEIRLIEDSSILQRQILRNFSSPFNFLKSNFSEYLEKLEELNIPPSVDVFEDFLYWYLRPFYEYWPDIIEMKLSWPFIIRWARNFTSSLGIPYEKVRDSFTVRIKIILVDGSEKVYSFPFYFPDFFADLMLDESLSKEIAPKDLFFPISNRWLKFRIISSPRLCSILDVIPVIAAGDVSIIPSYNKEKLLKDPLNYWLKFLRHLDTYDSHEDAFGFNDTSPFSPVGKKFDYQYIKAIKKAAPTLPSVVEEIWTDFEEEAILFKASSLRNRSESYFKKILGEMKKNFFSFMETALCAMAYSSLSSDHFIQGFQKYKKTRINDSWPALTESFLETYKELYGKDENYIIFKKLSDYKDPNLTKKESWNLFSVDVLKIPLYDCYFHELFKFGPDVLRMLFVDGVSPRNLPEEVSKALRRIGKKEFYEAVLRRL